MNFLGLTWSPSDFVHYLLLQQNEAETSLGTGTRLHVNGIYSGAKLISIDSTTFDWKRKSCNSSKFVAQQSFYFEEEESPKN